MRITNWSQRTKEFLIIVPIVCTSHHSSHNLCYRGAGISIIGGHIFIYSCSQTVNRKQLILKSKLRFQKELIRQYANL